MLISSAKSRHQNFDGKVLVDARCAHLNVASGRNIVKAWKSGRCLTPIFQAIAQEVVEVRDVINLLSGLRVIVFDSLEFNRVPVQNDVR